MIFLRILQSLILYICCAIIPADVFICPKALAEEELKKTEKAPLSAASAAQHILLEKPTKELNLKVGEKAPIEAQIKEQLKYLNDLPVAKKASAPFQTPLLQTATAHARKENEHLFIQITADKSFVSLASFAEGTTWYIVLAGVGDITLTQEEQIPNLQTIEVLKAERGEAVLKIGLKVRQTPTLVQTPKGMDLSFQAAYNFKSCNDLLQLPSSPEKPYFLRIKSGDQIIEFEDPQTHRRFWVLTVEKPSPEIDEHSYAEFRLLPSLRGVAIEKISEDLEITYQHRKVSITSPAGLSVSPSIASEDSLKPQSIFTKFNPLTAPDRIRALTALTKQPSHQLLQKNIELIWQYLGMGKIPEALSLTRLLEERYPDILLMPVFRALKGLTQLLFNRSHRANDLLKILSYDPEPSFWSRIAEAISNEFIDTDSLHHLVQYKNYFELLPLPLRVRLQGLILQTAILHKNGLVLKTYADKKFEPDDAFVEALFKLANIFIALETNETPQTLAQLEILSQSPVFRRVATLATLEKIKREEKNKKIPVAEILAQLNQLRFQWRGDLLEYKIAQHYIEQLTDNKLYAKTLPILRSLIKYFPEQAQKDKLHESMQKNLMTFFTQNPSPSIMESLSIFQEFGDLAPNTPEGDQVILKATSELIQLNLYQDALEILKKYTQNKLNHPDTSVDRKNMFAYKIATIHLLTKNFKECLSVLDTIGKPSADLTDDIALLRAEAHLQNNDFQAALDSLGTTPLQIEKKGELHFTKEQWPQAAVYYEKALSLLPEKEKKNRAKCIYNLALCYALEKNIDKLTALKETHESFMEESVYKNKFMFLTTDMAGENTLTSAELEKIDGFANTLKQVFKETNKK